MQIIHKDLCFRINETESFYISPYSLFLLKNYPLNFHVDCQVCDYGAGTGILGIVASSYHPKEIIFIEKSDEAHIILTQNIQSNLHAELNIRILSDENECQEQFDTILCNPASLPKVCNPIAFCNGGEMGLDMINQVIVFAQQHLLPDGRLYLIITSLLPFSIVQKQLCEMNMFWKIIDRECIAFRDHYAGVHEWVDSHRNEYSEMTYYERNGKLFEEIRLYEIQRMPL